MYTGKEIERRKLVRTPADSSVELIWKDESGERLFETGRVMDVSFGGMAVRSSQPVAAASCLILKAPVQGITALAQVRHCSWNRSAYRIGVRFLLKAALQVPLSEQEPDYYDFLRQASGDTTKSDQVDQIYKSLSFRYHPDNRDTGDPEVFLSIREIYRIAFSGRHSTPGIPATPAPATDFQSAFSGSRTERSRRLSVLGLLYQRRMTDCEDATMSVQDIAATTGAAVRELTFSLWYLREKGLVSVNDSAAYSISTKGVDLFEDALQYGAANATGGPNAEAVSGGGPLYIPRC